VYAKYRRLVWIYLFLSACWIGWGLCKPIRERDRASQEMAASANRQREECEAANANAENEYERREASWVKRGGLEPMLPPSPDDCVRPQALTLERSKAIAKETLGQTFARVGPARIVIFCLVPPIAGYLLILLYSRILLSESPGPA
jgi:hypothetical protein